MHGGHATARDTATHAALVICTVAQLCVQIPDALGCENNKLKLTNKLKLLFDVNA